MTEIGYHFKLNKGGRPPKIESKDLILNVMSKIITGTPDLVVKEIQKEHPKQVVNDKTIKKYLDILSNEKKIQKEIVSINRTINTPNPKRKRELAIYTYNLES